MNGDVGGNAMHEERDGDEFNDKMQHQYAGGSLGR